MKKNLTILKKFHGVMLLGMLIAVPISLAGQTAHSVGVTSNVFTPDELTLNVGDTVIWTNTQGNHNVNGTTTTFPSNPESFGNEVGAGWEFSHVFTVEGAYDYHCDPHAAFGMTGKITVVGNGPTGVDLAEDKRTISFYPNPATNLLHVVSEQNLETIAVYSVTGNKIFEFKNLGVAAFEIPLEGISPGVYFVDTRSSDNQSRIGRFVKR